MCLTTRDPAIKKAEEDIEVYKVGLLIGNQFIPRYRRSFVYNQNEQKPFVELAPYEHKNLGKSTVDEGYHSFNNIQNAIHSFDSSGINPTKVLVGVFIIPKGTNYIDGHFPWEGVPNRVSSTIVFKSLYVSKKRSWWKKLLKIK